MTAVWQRFWLRARPHLELNPVVVKELRQAVRSWFITGILLLFLIVLLFTMLAFLASQSTYLSPEQGLGQEIFMVLVVILAGASLLFIPAYTGIRLALERQETNLDLLYITTLTPGRIIRGKLMCGIYLTVLFFSACLPFVVLTNLLRGIDLPSIASIMGLLFVMVCGAVQVAVFIACLPVSTPFKAILALPFTGAMISLTSAIGMYSRQATRVGFVLFDNRWSVLTVAAFYLLGFGWFYLASVALISPRSLNRALPLRIYLTIIWLLSGIILTIVAFKIGSVEPLRFWLVFCLLLVATALTVTIGETDQLSLRVQRQIPIARWRRCLAFFFFNGAAQGLAWIFVLTLLSVLAAVWIYYLDQYWTAGALARSGYAALAQDFFVIQAIWLGYALSYSLTGLFLQRTFFPLRSPLYASVIAFVIPALWAILPNFLRFLSNRLSWNVLEDRQLGNVFNVLLIRDPNFQQGHLWFAAGWAMLALVVNLPWFYRQVRAFRPLPRTESRDTP